MSHEHTLLSPPGESKLLADRDGNVRVDFNYGVLFDRTQATPGEPWIGWGDRDQSGLYLWNDELSAACVKVVNDWYEEKTGRYGLLCISQDKKADVVTTHAVCVTIEGQTLAAFQARHPAENMLEALVLYVPYPGEVGGVARG